MAAQEVGPIGLEQRRAMSGLELFRAMVAGELPAPPIGRTNHFRLVEAEHGRVVFEGRPSLDFYNPLGTVHGGWIATLLDSALGCAVHSTLPAGQGYTTLEIKVNYVRPVLERTGPVRSTGRIVHAGSRVATADATLTDAAGKLYAHGSTTCLVFPL